MFLKKICLMLALLGAVFFVGCVDPYGPGPGYYGGVPTGYYPAYPADVYPYYRGSTYYYPYYTGKVWVYNAHSRPIHNWTGPPLRHHDSPPRHWQGGGHHRGVFAPGRSQPQIRHGGQHGRPSFNSGSMMRTQPQQYRHNHAPAPRGGGRGRRNQSR